MGNICSRSAAPARRACSGLASWCSCFATLGAARRGALCLHQGMQHLACFSLPFIFSPRLRLPPDVIDRIDLPLALSSTPDLLSAARRVHRGTARMRPQRGAGSQLPCGADVRLETSPGGYQGRWLEVLVSRSCEHELGSCGPSPRPGACSSMSLG